MQTGEYGMKSRDLSGFIFISKHVSLSEIDGTAPNARKMSDDRPASVAGTRRPSPPRGNPPFLGTILPPSALFC